MRTNLLKHLFALALGGMPTAGAGATIDPEHLGRSLKELVQLAASGAVAAVVTLHIRAPKDNA